MNGDDKRDDNKREALTRAADLLVSLVGAGSGADQDATPGRWGEIAKAVVTMAAYFESYLSAVQVPPPSRAPHTLRCGHPVKLWMDGPGGRCGRCGWAPEKPCPIAPPCAECSAGHA